MSKHDKAESPAALRQVNVFNPEDIQPGDVVRLANPRDAREDVELVAMNITISIEQARHIAATLTKASVQLQTDAYDNELRGFKHLTASRRETSTQCDTAATPLWRELGRLKAIETH